MARLLIERGADPVAMDNNGNVPLKIAVYFKFDDMARLLTGTEGDDKAFVHKPWFGSPLSRLDLKLDGWPYAEEDGEENKA